MNVITGSVCPAVICQRKGKAFKWQCPLTDVWREGDELPDVVKYMLPEFEIRRVKRHEVARMAIR